MASEKLSLHRQLMYISCIDDSGPAFSQNADQTCPFHVVGGPIISDQKYLAMESALTSILERIVPGDQWDSFEFHASDMFRATGPFESIGIQKCRESLEAVLNVISRLKIPKLQVRASGDLTDVAFRLYLQSLQEWFLVAIFKNEAAPGILIVDESTDPKAKQAIQKAFRTFRRKHGPDRVGSGLTHHLLDDIDFGDSKHSIGIQLADICMYFTARHLGENTDSEGFYSLIKSNMSNLKFFHETD